MKVLLFALALLSWQHVLVYGQIFVRQEDSDFEQIVESDLWKAFYEKSQAKRLEDLGN